MKPSTFVVCAFLFFSQYSSANNNTDVPSSESRKTGTWTMIFDTAMLLAQNDPRLLLEFTPEKCGNLEKHAAFDIPDEAKEKWNATMEKLCGMEEDEQWLVYNMVQNQQEMLRKIIMYSGGMASAIMKGMCGHETEGEESLICMLAKGIETGISGVEAGSGGNCSLFDLAKIVSDPDMYFDQFGIDVQKCMDTDVVLLDDEKEMFLCEQLSTYERIIDSFRALMSELKDEGIPALFDKGTECTAEDISDYCKVKRLLRSTMSTVQSAEKWANVTVTADLMSILKAIAGEIDCSNPNYLEFCDSEFYKLVQETMHTANSLAGALTNSNGDLSIFSSIENVVREIESVNKYAVFGEAVFQLISNAGMIKQFFMFQSPKEFCEYGDAETFLICSKDMDPEMKEDLMQMIGAVWNPMYSQTIGALIDVVTNPDAMGRVLQDTSLQFCSNGEPIPESLDALCYLVRDREYNELIDLIASAGTSLNAMAPVICSGMSEYERVAALVKLILNETVIESLINLAANEAECLMKDLDLGDFFDMGRFLPGSDGKGKTEYREDDDEDFAKILPLIILILLIMVVLLLVMVLFMQYRLMKEILRSRKKTALLQGLPQKSVAVPNMYKSNDVDNIEKSIQVMNSDPLSVPRNLRQPSNVPPPAPVYKTPSLFNTSLPGSSEGSVKDFDASSTAASYTELVNR